MAYRRCSRVSRGSGGGDAEELPGADDFVVVFFGPHPDSAEGRAQAVAQGGELVLDFGRDDGVDGAGDEAVAFHLAHGFSEHFLADVTD